LVHPGFDDEELLFVGDVSSVEFVNEIQRFTEEFVLNGAVAEVEFRIDLCSQSVKIRTARVVINYLRIALQEKGADVPYTPLGIVKLYLFVVPLQDVEF
jgi:hypothetical protein